MPNIRRLSDSTTNSGNSSILGYYYGHAPRSSSSLAISPSPSSMLGASPSGAVSPSKLRSKSQSSLRNSTKDLEDEAEPPVPAMDQARLALTSEAGSAGEPRPTSSKHSSDSSGRSTYSMEGSQTSSAGQPFDLDPLDRPGGVQSTSAAQTYAADKGHGGRFDVMRDSVASGTTVRENRANSKDDTGASQRTPKLPSEPATGPPQAIYYAPAGVSGLSPVLGVSPTVTPQETPTLASMSRMTQNGQDLPGPGAPDFAQALHMPTTSRSSVTDWRSGYAHHSDDGEPGAHSRPRGSSVPLANLLDSPGKGEGRATRSPRPDVPERSPARSRQASPTRPTGVPPRSSLRNQPNPLNASTSSPKALDSDLLATPPLAQTAQTPVGLPFITHTAASPFPRSDVTARDSSEPRRPSRSPSRLSPASLHDASMEHTPSITDLTAMLGQAIDEIGLIDSRDTPPPSVTSPTKVAHEVYPTVELGSSAAGSSTSRESISSPGHIPARGTSLPISHMSPVSTKGSSLIDHRPRRSTLTDSLRKMSSFTSLRSTLPPSITSQSQVAAKPWPAAMLYGSIKSMKHPGERALAYARAVNELARADSGLQGWCATSIASFSRTPAKPTKASGFSALGLGATVNPPYPSISVPEPDQHHPHLRNVSASSEFPMRQDAYAAREISQRVLDPTDHPTALPTTLPYPQLQQLQGQGIRPSASMQSVSSLSSGGIAGPTGKRGFFSRLGGKSKESSSALGPPSRSLAISSPAPARLSSDGGRLQATQAAPSGPRGPRAAGTPPLGPLASGVMSNEPRRSLDSGHSRFFASGANTGRGSFESARPAKTSAPPLRGSALPVGVGGGVAVNEAELRTMVDVLPQAEKGILRAYLGRAGDAMSAIG